MTRDCDAIFSCITPAAFPHHQRVGRAGAAWVTQHPNLEQAQVARSALERSMYLVVITSCASVV